MDVEPVVVGVDGSPDSKRALRWAVEYGRRFEVPVHALSTWDIPQVYGYPVTFREDEYNSFEVNAHTLLDETIEDVAGEESQVVKRVERGHPAIALVAASKSAQLLVVGSRGHGAFVGMLMGSVSQHCVQHAQCPVVVMRERADES